MENDKDLKVTRARKTGVLYFAALGMVNLGATIFNGQLRPLDVVILVVTLLPMLITKKWFLFVFGLMASLVSLYMGAACLKFNLTPGISTQQISFIIGYLFAAANLYSAALLIYAGLQDADGTNSTRLELE